jgi:hypothetical protein
VRIRRCRRTAVRREDENRNPLPIGAAHGVGRKCDCQSALNVDPISAPKIKIARRNIRKWRLSLVAANQLIAQLPEDLQHAVFDNAGTLAAFRVGALDAKRLAAKLGLGSPATLTQTTNHHAWLKVMRDGAPMQPRLIYTLAPPPEGSRLEKVIAFARASHMMPRKAVEERIAPSFPKASMRRPRRGRRDADRG